MYIPPGYVSAGRIIFINYITIIITAEVQQHVPNHRLLREISVKITYNGNACTVDIFNNKLKS